MAGFPKNPLAGPNPFRDAEGRNPFRDDAPPADPSPGSTVSLGEATTADASGRDATGAYAPSAQPQVRAYQVGDFTPLASARSGRVTMATWSSVILTAVGWGGLGLAWLVLADQDAMQFSTAVWFLLATILASLALGWSAAELSGIKLGAIDPRAEEQIRSSRRKAWFALILSPAGLIAIVVRLATELG